jgi:hypothetical protein
MTIGLWAALTIAAAVCVLVFGTLAAIYLNRLMRHPSTEVSERLWGHTRVIKKLGKREPMTPDELALARRVIADRRHPMAFCIPLSFISMGLFYVFGSLEHLHGATPSERTFLGFIPVITSTNLILRMVKAAVMKRKLAGAVVVEPDIEPLDATDAAPARVAVA